MIKIASKHIKPKTNKNINSELFTCSCGVVDELSTSCGIVDESNAVISDSKPICKVCAGKETFKELFNRVSLKVRALLSCLEFNQTFEQMYCESIGEKVLSRKILQGQNVKFVTTKTKKMTKIVREEYYVKVELMLKGLRSRV